MHLCLRVPQRRPHLLLLIKPLILVFSVCLNFIFSGSLKENKAKQNTKLHVFIANSGPSWLWINYIAGSILYFCVHTVYNLSLKRIPPRGDIYFLTPCIGANIMTWCGSGMKWKWWYANCELPGLEYFLSLCPSQNPTTAMCEQAWRSLLKDKRTCGGEFNYSNWGHSRAAYIYLTDPQYVGQPSQGQ